MKIVNREINIKVFDKNGKIKNQKTIKNLILDNYLKLTVEKAVGIALQGIAPVDTLYLKFNTSQVITKESTTMVFDLKLSNSVQYSQQITNPNAFTIENFYELEMPAEYSGQKLYGLGFGIEETFYADYLMAFVDVSQLSIELLEGEKVQFVRVDDFITDGHLIPGSTIYGQYPFHLGYLETLSLGISYWAQLSEIQYSYYEDGINPYISYQVYEVDGLNFNILIPYTQKENDTIVEFEIPDPFRVSEILSDYPQEDYPQEDYPAPINRSFKSKIYKYDIWVYDQFDNFIKIDSYSYVKNLNLQNITKDNKNIIEEYKIERGGI